MLHTSSNTGNSSSSSTSGFTTLANGGNSVNNVSSSSSSGFSNNAGVSSNDAGTPPAGVFHAWAPQSPRVVEVQPDEVTVVADEAPCVEASTSPKKKNSLKRVCSPAADA